MALMWDHITAVCFLVFVGVFDEIPSFIDVFVGLFLDVSERLENFFLLFLLVTLQSRRMCHPLERCFPQIKHSRFSFYMGGW